MLRKPGRPRRRLAMGVRDGSAVDLGFPVPARRRSAAAIASGAIRYGRASLIARFVAKSPWTGSAGSLDLDRRACVRPRQRRQATGATARSQARSIAARTRLRNGGDITAGCSPIPVAEGVQPIVAGRSWAAGTGDPLTVSVRRRTGISEPWWDALRSGEVYVEERTRPVRISVQFFRHSTGVGTTKGSPGELSSSSGRSASPHSKLGDCR